MTKPKSINEKNLKITNRDIEIFKALTKYHLTGRMIFDLSQTFKNPFTNITNARARLSQLYQGGYLKRDQRLVIGRSNNENYYFLTLKSAAFFAELEGIEKKSILFQPIRIGQQSHTFLVSEIMVKMELDIYNFRDICQLIGFIRENNFIILGEKKRTIKPDGTIFLDINGHKFLLFLEIDLSTEVVRSTKPQVRTVRRKIEIYSEFKKYFQDNLIIHSIGGINGYRVLIVCKSIQRLQNLANLAANMNKSNMFWLTTEEWFFSRNCLFDRIWTLPDGQFYSLF